MSFYNIHYMSKQRYARENKKCFLDKIEKMCRLLSHRIRSYAYTVTRRICKNIASLYFFRRQKLSKRLFPATSGFDLLMIPMRPERFTYST